MFDIKKILSRSWHILWSYRMLWVFGFILALATGGDRFSSSSRYTVNDRGGKPPASGEAPDGWEGLHGDTFAEKAADGIEQMRRGIRLLQEEHPVEFRMGVSALITLIAVLLLSGVVVTILRYIAETSAIRMVDEYEGQGVRVGFRQAWKYGRTREAWKLFLANLVVHLPVLALFVVLGLVAWWIIGSILAGDTAAIISSAIAGGGLAFLSIFITVILMALLYVLRDFAWRMIVLDGMGVREGLRAALALLRREWRNVGLMWLVMLGVKIAWGIVFFVLLFPLLVLSIITAMGGLVASVLPSLLAAGIAGLFRAPEYWPWVFAAIVGMPVFFVVAFSPILLVGGWWEIYNSSVWTLTYRELKALELVDAGEAAAGSLEDGRAGDEDAPEGESTA